MLQHFLAMAIPSVRPSVCYNADIVTKLIHFGSRGLHLQIAPSSYSSRGGKVHLEIRTESPLTPTEGIQ